MRIHKEGCQWGRPPGPVDYLVCPNCQKGFTAPVWEKRKFCCHQCSVEYNREKHILVLRANKDKAGRKKILRKQITCPTCGKVFEIRITETRKFCSLRCIRHTEECKEGQRIRSFGRVFSEETRKKMGISKLGEKNPMKRSEVKEKVRAYRVGKSLQESGHGSDCACCVCKAKRGETKGENSPYYGHHSSDETRKKQREAKLGKPSPNKGKKVSLQRLQKIRDLWKDPEYVKKVFRKVFPDKPEEYLRSLSDQNFPGQFKYTGNGQLIVAGKCPDFVHTSKPLLIELFGDYWHGQERTGIPNEQHERERIELFRLAGYETLVIWEHELKDPSRVVEKISGFLRISYVRS